MGKKHTRNKHDMEHFELERASETFRQIRVRPGSSRKCGGLPTLASFQGGVPLQGTDVQCWKKFQEFLQTCRSAKREVESDQAVDSNQDQEESVTLTSMDMDLLGTQPKPTEPPYPETGPSNHGVVKPRLESANTRGNLDDWSLFSSSPLPKNGLSAQWTQNPFRNRMRSSKKARRCKKAHHLTKYEGYRDTGSSLQCWSVTCGPFRRTLRAVPTSQKILVGTLSYGVLTA